MWWPGSGSGPREASAEVEEASSEPEMADEVMEILSEEDLSGSSPPLAAYATPDPDLMAWTGGDGELDQLKDQFLQQEQLLGQLKGVLKSNQDKLSHKERQVQDYAARLAQIRHRPLNTSSPIAVEGAGRSMSGAEPAPAAPTVGTGKIRLLKKQLEEARMKESEDTERLKDLERFVQELQRDIEDRDKMIRRMKEDQYSIASYRESPPGSPFIMSPGQQSPGQGSPPMAHSYDSSAGGAFESFSRGFTDKDEKILELHEKNIELERQVLDLEENLRAQSELVRVRTQAVALMSADLTAQGQSTLDQLEETRVAMKEMQRKFAEQELEWKKNQSLMKADLEAKTQKIQSLEENVDHLEKARFDLSARNATLQEKVVGLQSNMKQIKKDNKEIVDQLANDKAELTKTVETLEKRLRQATEDRDDKNQKLIEELNELASDDEFGQKLLDLQNQLAEVEEEKGALQLKLVDYEEENGPDVQKRILELESKIQDLTEALNDQVQVFADLKAEKEYCEEVLLKRDQEINSKSSQIANLLSTDEERSKTMVSLEMRALELEEEKDKWIEDRQEYELKLQRLEGQLKDQGTPIKVLEEKLASLQSEHASLQQIHSELKEQFKQNDVELIEKCDKLEHNEVALKELEKLLLSKNVEIAESFGKFAEKDQLIEELQTNLNQVNTRLQEEQVAKQAILDKLNEFNVDELEQRIQSLQDQLTSSNANLEAQTGLAHNYRAEADHLTTEVARIQSELADKQQEISQTLLENENLTRNLTESKDFVQSLEERLALLDDLEAAQIQLKQDISDRDSDILSKNEKISHLQDELAQLEKKLNEQSQEESSEEDVRIKLEKELSERDDEILSKSERISDLEDQLSNLKEALKENEGFDSQIDELEQVIEKKDQTIQSLENKLTEYEDVKEQVLQLHLDLQNHSEEIASQTAVIDDLKETLKETKVNIADKEKLIRNYQERINDMEDQLAESSGIERVNELLQEKDEVNLQLEAKVANLMKYKEQVQQLHLDVQNYREEISSLTEKLSSFKNERHHLTTQISVQEDRLQNSIAKIQELEELASESALKQEYAQRTSSPPSAVSSRCGSESNIKEFTSLQSGMAEKAELLKQANDKLNQREDELLKVKRQLEEVQESLNTSEKEKTALYEQLNTLSEQMMANETNKNEGDQVLNGRIKVLEMEIDDQVIEIKALKEKNDKLNVLQKSLQENYDALLAGKGDNKDVIKERDTLKTKYAALTDKAKKLIVKCKQLDEQLQKKNQEVIEVKAVLDQLQNDMSELKRSNQGQEEELLTMKGRLADLQDTIQSKDEEIEKWQTEAMEKDQKLAASEADKAAMEARVASLENDPIKDDLEALKMERTYLKEGLQESEASNEKLCQEIQELKGQLEEQVSREEVLKLREANEMLRQERTKIYENQVVLRDEITELQKERVRLNSALEDAKTEIGAIRQSHLVSQMLDSPLLRDEEPNSLRGSFDPETSSVQAEAGSTIQDDENSSRRGGFEDEEGWSNDGWDEESSQVDVEEPEEDDEDEESKESRKISVIENSSIPTSAATQESHEPPSKTLETSEPKVEEKPALQDEEEQGFGGFSENDDGWGGWEDDPVEIPEETDDNDNDIDEKPAQTFEAQEDVVPVVVAPTEQPQSLGTMSSASGQLKPEIEADIEDGWGDDSWGGGWGESENLGDNLKLTDDDGLRGSSEDRETTPPIRSDQVDGNEAGSNTFDWQGKVVEKEAQIESLESELKEMRLKMTAMEESIRSSVETKETAEEKIRVMNEKLQAKEKAMEKLIQDTEKRVAELQNSQLSATDCKEKMVITDSMIEDYKQRIDELSNEQQSLQIELEESYKELEKLRPLKKVKAELEEAEEKIQSLEEYKEELQSESSKLRDDLQLAETELQNVNEQLETVENDRSDLKIKVKEINEHKSNLESQIEELQVLLNSHEAELSGLKHRNEELESTFGTLTIRNDELTKDMDEREKQIELLQQELENLNFSLSKVQEEKLQADADEQNSNLTQNLEDQISNLQRLIQEKELESATTCTDLENEKASYEELIEELRAENANLQAQIHTLRDDVAHSQEQERKHLENVRNMHDQMRKAQSPSSSTSSQTESSEKLTQLEETLRGVNASLRTKENELSMIQEQLTQRDEMIANLQRQVEAAQVRNEEEPQQQQQGLDLAESNRPPPDVTYQRIQPDVTPFHQPSIRQPDIMQTSQDQFDQPQASPDHGWFEREPAMAQNPNDFFQNQDPGAPNAQPHFDYFQPQEPQLAPLASQYFEHSEPHPQQPFEEVRQPDVEPSQPVDSFQQPQAQPVHAGLLFGDENVPGNEAHFFEQIPSAPKESEIQPVVSSVFEPVPSPSNYFQATPSSYFNQAEVTPASNYFGTPSVSHQASSSALGTPTRDLSRPESVANVFASDPNSSHHGSPEHVQTASVGTETSGEATENQAELLAQYQAQLAEYQQAIADWQVWAETQGQEQGQLQENLKYYTDAYNATTLELEQLKTQMLSKEGANEELDKIKSRLRTTELEVKDLNETIDRLQCEKADLDQEILELNRSNEALRSEKDELERGSETVDLVVFEEVKTQVEELTGQRDRLNQELTDALNERKKLEHIKDSNLEAIQKLQDELNGVQSDKSSLLAQLSEFELKVSEAHGSVEQMKVENSTLKLQIETLNQTVDSLTEQSQALHSNKVDLEAYNALIAEKTDIENRLKHSLDELERSQSSALEATKPNEDLVEKHVLEAMEKNWKESQEREEALKTEFEAFKQANDVSQYQTAIEQWQVWAETQNQTMVELQNSLEQYTEAYNKAAADLQALQESSQTDDADKLALQSNLVELQELKASTLAKDEKLTLLESEKGRLEGLLAISNEKDQQIATLESQKNDLEAKILDLQSQLSVMDQIKAEAKEAVDNRNAIQLKLQELQTRLEEERGQNEEKTSTGVAEENQRLNIRINILRNNFSQMESKCNQLQVELNDMNNLVKTLTAEKDQLSERIDQLSQEKELLQNVEVENESLKLRLETLESEKMTTGNTDAASSVQDYAAFQELNQNLQSEIQSLRTYIQQQQSAYEYLQQQQQQQQQQSGTDKSFEHVLLKQMEQDLQLKDQVNKALEEENEQLKLRLSGGVTPSSLEVSSLVPNSPERKRSSYSPEVSQIFDSSATGLVSENDRLKQDLDKSVRENRHLTSQMASWKQQLADSSQVEEYDDDDESPHVLKSKQEQAWRSVGALQLRVEELTLEVTKLLEERDTLQLKLSNALRQYERQKESSSRVSTAASTPIPWMDNSTDIRELRAKIEELSKLNYNKDVELQKQRQQMDAMQVKIRHSSTSSSFTSPSRTTPSRRESQSRDPRATPVLHL